MTKLNVLWTTNSKETIQSMISMYLGNAIANKWFDEINVVIWGASSKLSGEDKPSQKLLSEMMEKGVKFEACKACADRYNSSEIMSELGVDVKYMGKPLTEYIKSEDEFLSI